MIKCDTCTRPICIDCGPRPCDNTDCWNNIDGYCVQERCEREEEE